MSSVIFFDEKNIEDFVAVSRRVAVVKILCIDDPGWHIDRDMGFDKLSRNAEWICLCEIPFLRYKKRLSGS